MALSIELLCCGVRLASYLGPPGAAAVICAATPTYMYLETSSVDGAMVSDVHSGLEQMKDALREMASTTFDSKSSRFFVIPSPWAKIAANVRGGNAAPRARLCR